jgi:hypothetical protein
MVNPVVLSRVFDAHHIPDVFYNADRTRFPRFVGADRADFLVRDHPADTAIFHLVPETVDRGGEMMDALFRLPQQMQGKPQRASLSHTGKGTDRFDSILKQTGRIFVLKVHARKVPL